MVNNINFFLNSLCLSNDKFEIKDENVYSNNAKQYKYPHFNVLKPWELSGRKLFIIQ